MRTYINIERFLAKCKSNNTTFIPCSEVCTLIFMSSFCVFLLHVLCCQLVLFLILPLGANPRNFPEQIGPLTLWEFVWFLHMLWYVMQIQLLNGVFFWNIHKNADLCFILKLNFVKLSSLSLPMDLFELKSNLEFPDVNLDKQTRRESEREKDWRTRVSQSQYFIEGRV